MLLRVLNVPLACNSSNLKFTHGPATESKSGFLPALARGFPEAFLAGQRVDDLQSRPVTLLSWRGCVRFADRPGSGYQHAGNFSTTRRRPYRVSLRIAIQAALYNACNMQR